ncbi:hypothetical protein LQW54_000793 [Pestalotiopsis sp. IQ-011]
MDKTSGNEKLRDLVKRTFIGAVTSTFTCVLNITIMMALNGEPGWICLLSCNLDLLADTIIVQYVTSRDNSGTSRSDHSDRSKTSVAVERSIHIYTTTSSKTATNFDKNGSVAEVEGDIEMGVLGVSSQGYQKSTDKLKKEPRRETRWDDDIELGNVGNLDLGTQTHIVATSTRPFA